MYPLPQRISVFEPYQMRDTMQHFCEKHLDKIKEYMQKVMVRLPLPVKCSIEGQLTRLAPGRRRQLCSEMIGGRMDYGMGVTGPGCGVK